MLTLLWFSLSFSSIWFCFQSLTSRLLGQVLMMNKHISTDKTYPQQTSDDAKMLSFHDQRLLNQSNIDLPRYESDTSKSENEWKDKQRHIANMWEHLPILEKTMTSHHAFVVSLENNKESSVFMRILFLNTISNHPQSLKKKNDQVLAHALRITIILSLAK